MPRESSDAERIPLLRSPFHNTYYSLNNDDRSCSFGYWIGYAFAIIGFSFLSINLVFYFIESNESISLKGVSNIPHEYYLGLKDNEWSNFNNLDYVIETSPPSDPKFSKFYQDLNSTTLSYDRLKLAEIVAKNYRVWAPAYYEVIENRYSKKENYTLLTTKSHMSGLWYILWPPKVRITFFSSDNDDKEHKNDNDGGRKTKESNFINSINDEVKILLKCDYEISWNYNPKYFGEILRKCPNQEYWIKIAYVKGTSEWGMQWLDPERIETYGIVTKPAYGINNQMR
jgi:hypothetical protein